MHSPARNAYLENQILSAAPQQLRLMLIEGALRFARQSMMFAEQGQDEQASTALGRARSIVGELMSSITPDGSPLTRRVASLYLFLFERFAEAQFQRDPRRVQEAIEILEVERETWKLVCTQLAHAPEAAAKAGSPHRTGPHQAPPPANLGDPATPFNGGLLLEA